METLSLKLSPQNIKRLDAYIEKVRRQTGGITIKKGAALRALVERALDRELTPINRDATNG